MIAFGQIGNGKPKSKCNAKKERIIFIPEGPCKRPFCGWPLKFTKGFEIRLHLTEILCGRIGHGHANQKKGARNGLERLPIRLQESLSFG